MIRLLLIFAVAVMLVPLPEEHTDHKPGSQVAVETASVAYDLYGDLQAFCLRNKTTCEKSAELTDLFKSKLRVGADMLAAYLDRDQKADRDPILTGSVSKQRLATEN